MEVSEEVNEFVKEVESVLREYAKTITALERERRERVEGIKEDREIELEEMWRLIDELNDKYDRMKEIERECVIDEIDRIARKHSLKLDGDVFVLEDEHTYSSGMGFKHTSLYYLVCVIKLSESRALKVYGEFTESDVYGDYSLNFNYTSLKEVPIIDPEKTPFSHSLIRAIPWGYIRDTWIHNIDEMMKEIVESEWKGREELKKTVEKVEKVLRASAWVYDYQHVLNALRKVREKYDI